MGVVTRRKEILLKAVALAIPTFTISVFKLSKTLCEELKSLMANFWWGQKEEEERKVHWVGWDKICRSKFQWGLGFKKLHTFNTALLTKKF